jgi:hypothetical protein
MFLWDFRDQLLYGSIVSNVDGMCCDTGRIDPKHLHCFLYTRSISIDEDQMSATCFSESLRALQVGKKYLREAYSL